MRILTIGFYRWIMQIKTIHYSALINLGNYNNERIGFTAEIAPDESIPDVLAELRQRVVTNASLDAEKVQQTLYDGRNKLKDLESKIHKATAEWNAIAEFLRAQGIKPESPNMPQFTNLLPEIKSDRVVEGEIEEEDPEY